jgi:hypothetical protein
MKKARNILITIFLIRTIFPETKEDIDSFVEGMFVIIPGAIIPILLLGWMLKFSMGNTNTRRQHYIIRHEKEEEHLH